MEKTIPAKETQPESAAETCEPTIVAIGEVYEDTRNTNFFGHDDDAFKTFVVYA